MIGRRSFTYKLFVCALFIVSLGASAQYQSFKNYTPDDGLPSEMIYQSFQDKEGYIWLATAYGVSKYDGYRFTNYTTKSGLSDDEVFQFIEDDKGRIWFLTLNGKVSYFYQGKFHNSITNTELQLLDSESMITNVQEAPNGDLWFSTYNGVLKVYDQKGKVTKIFSDRFGTINKVIFFDNHRFLLFSRKGIYLIRMGDDLSPDHWDIQKVPFYYEYETMPFHIKVKQVSDTHVIFAFTDKIYEYDALTNRIRLFFQSKGKVPINNICLSEGNILWICMTKGLIKYDILTKKYHPVNGALSNHSVSHVLTDREGNHWVSTLRNGVYFSTNVPILNYGENSSFKVGPVNSLGVDDKRRLVMGMKNGTVILLKGRGFEKWDFDYFFNAQSPVKKVLYANGWYIIGAAELFIRKDTIKSIKLGISDMIEHPSGDYWLASSRGVFRFHSSDFDSDFFDFKKRKLFFGRANKIFLDSKDRILVATDNDVLAINNLEDRTPEVKPLNLGLRVTDFCRLRDSTMMLATRGEGLFLKNSEMSVQLTRSDGLPSDYCNALHLDDDVIWLGTNGGVCKIDWSGSEPKIRTFNVEDGLSSNTVNDVLVFDDTVWVATEKGLSFFSKHLVKEETKPIEVRFSKFQVNDEDVDLFEEVGELNLEHDQNNIFIAYAGLSFKSRGNILYRYRLSENLGWRYTKNTSLEFSTLAAGTYNFTVEAKSETSDWGPPNNFRFTVNQVFWKTWVFQVLVVFGSGVLLWMIIQIVLSRKRKKRQTEYKLALSELKALRAQINPHFMYNALNSIQFFLQKSKNDEATSYLNKFARLMRLILNHSGKTDISIREEVEALTYYLELEKLRLEGKFNFDIKIDADIDEYNTEIPAMVLQPFVENAIWHGLAPKPGHGSLKVLFEKQNQKVMISILDDGIGRHKSKQLSKGKDDSQGIKLIEERIELLNRSRIEKISLHIGNLSDKDESGTKVIIMVPE